MNYNVLLLASFGLVLINSFAKLCKRLDLKIVTYFNILFYGFIFVLFLKLNILPTSADDALPLSASPLMYFIILANITSLLFSNVKLREDINSSLFISIIFILNIKILFSTDILKISILLALFEMLELFILSNEINLKKSLLRNFALTKIFSVIFLFVANVFIAISKSSTDLMESDIQSYALYNLGVCFFVIYALSVIYITPFEGMKKRLIFTSSNFSFICSILPNFAIKATVIVFILGKLILGALPLVQEKMLLSLTIILLISMVFFAFKRNEKK